MHDVTIDVDVGEMRSGVPALLQKRDAGVRVLQLATGDYVVGDGIGVERKSVLDLHYSISSRRLWSQLATYRAELRRLYLLVEGSSLDDGKISPAGVRGALLEIGDRGVTVIRTVDVHDTAEWILRLAVRAQRRGKRPRARLRVYPPAVAPRDLIAGIRGIGPRRAELLIERFGSIRGIASAHRDELQSVPGVGPVLAEVISTALT